LEVIKYFKINNSFPAVQRRNRSNILKPIKNSHNLLELIVSVNLGLKNVSFPDRCGKSEAHGHEGQVEMLFE
jgi:hypothetical protein